jgi:drug/metabolite transporter (DMT)-like permease
MALSTASRARLQATLAVAGTLLFWWKRGGVIATVIAIVAVLLALGAWAAPALYAPVQRECDRVLKLLLAALTWLLLGLVYLTIFTPLRAWWKIRGRDPLQRRSDPQARTYLQSVPPASAGSFDRQF